MYGGWVSGKDVILFFPVIPFSPVMSSFCHAAVKHYYRPDRLVGSHNICIYVILIAL